MTVVLEFLKISIRCEYLCPWLADFHTPNSNQALSALIGERSQDYGIDNTENGGTRADAESKCGHRHGGKARTLTQHTGSEAQILPQRLDKRFPAGTADNFLRNFEIPPLQAHGAKCILAAHALLHLFFGCHLQKAV